MCLGIPGQVVERVPGYGDQLALVDVVGGRRQVNVGMLGGRAAGTRGLGDHSHGLRPREGRRGSGATGAGRVGADGPTADELRSRRERRFVRVGWRARRRAPRAGRLWGTVLVDESEHDGNSGSSPAPRRPAAPSGCTRRTTSPRWTPSSPRTASAEPDVSVEVFRAPTGQLTCAHRGGGTRPAVFRPMCCCCPTRCRCSSTPLRTCCCPGRLPSRTPFRRRRGRTRSGG